MSWKELKFKDCENDEFAIRNYKLTPEDISVILLREALNPRLSGENHGINAGHYVKLVQKNNHDESWWDTVMSNTPMEFDTNKEFLENARGDVLIAGLGLGLALNEIQDKSEVNSITVVEKNVKVIELVKPQLPLNAKTTIINADIFAFETKQKFDTIFIDIWNNICGDDWNNIKLLKRKFKKNLKPNAWLGVWREQDFKREGEKF